MCVYCMIADEINDKFWKPYKVPEFVPVPMPQVNPWDREALDTLKEILDAVKRLEKKVSPCDCEPAEEKVEFINEIRKYLDELEAKEPRDQI